MKLFPDDRLENHLRSLADLPLKETEPGRQPAKRRAAFAPREADPGKDEGDQQSGEEVAA
jgi:hypothetical protein